MDDFAVCDEEAKAMMEEPPSEAKIPRGPHEDLEITQARRRVYNSLSKSQPEEVLLIAFVNCQRGISCSITHEEQVGKLSRAGWSEARLKGLTVKKGKRKCLLEMPISRDKFIVDNLKTLYFACHETSSITASWCLVLLAMHPDWQTRVRAEVADICKGSFPDVDMLRSMKLAAADDDDDDDDVDLSGEETEEEKKAAEERVATVKASTKKKESGKSSVLMDVRPWDDETDMKKLEEAVRSVQLVDLLWGASKLVPVGYGIKKLQIMLTIVD
ncbi:hypothetical protein ACFE04_027426 [Oxalis oulophora]